VLLLIGLHEGGGFGRKRRFEGFEENAEREVSSVREESKVFAAENVES
jgi:hypothetical protein